MPANQTPQPQERSSDKVSGLSDVGGPLSTSSPSADVAPSPFPFKATRRAYDLALQSIPTRDLLAEIETARWLALDVTGDAEAGGSHAVALLQLEAMLDEVLRRERLMRVRANDPVQPTWPRHDDTLRSRIDAVKGAFPIERFCTDLLDARLVMVGPHRWKAHCPLPGHEDRTPSFVIYSDHGRAWCFGCNRGGDVITLTGYMLGLERFYDRLEYLERLSASEGLGAS